MLISHWLKTFSSLTQNSRLVMVMLVCVLLTLVLVGLFIAGVMWFLLSYDVFAAAWLETGLDVAGGLLAFVVAWFAAPAIMPAIAGLFEEYIVAATYHNMPNAPKGKEPPFFQSLYYDVRFGVVGLFYNLLALPLYLVPGVNVAVYYLLNGYLLGRGFFIITARWHLGDVAHATRLYQQHRKQLFLHGLGLAFLATLPVASLFVPFIGIVLMTHVYGAIKRNNSSDLAK